MDIAELGRRVKAERKRLGWKQGKLAARSQLNKNTIVNLERGRSGNLETIEAVARAFEIPLQVLMFGSTIANLPAPPEG